MSHILVVDDSVVDLKLASSLLLKNTDWTVATARNGKEGLDELELELPDLVVTDLQMPVMNGLELVEAIRNEYPLIPVILMTADGSESIAVEALEKGAASYVPKEQLAEDLVTTVTRILATSAQRRNRRRLQNYVTNVAFVIDNDLELISALVAEIRSLVQERWLFDENEAVRIASAVDEAVSNAYYHGNLEVSSDLREEDANAYHDLANQRREEEPYMHRKIHVSLSFSKEQISVKVRDEGPGFDPSSLPDPTSPGYLQRASGRGVLLMRSFMDEIRYNSIANEVNMTKRVTRFRDDHVLDEDD